MASPHQFWDTQPVRLFGDPNPEKVGRPKLKQEEMKVENVSKDPVALPEAFEWCTVDLQNDGDAQEVYQLLVENYVEDSDGVFRFDYPIDFLKWTLCTPNYNKEWHVGVRAKGKSSLYGFISGTAIKT